MKRTFVTLLAASMAVAAGAAYADESTGVIKTIDTGKHQIELRNLERFLLPANTDLSKFKVGEKVKIEYRLLWNGEERRATSIVALN